MPFFRRIFRIFLVCALVSALWACAGARADLTWDQASGLYTQAATGDQAALATLMTQAQKGGPTAQYHLALLYANGQGVAQNWGQAAQWYRKAAQQGQAYAQNNLAALYANGDGVPASMVAAYALFSTAAAQDVRDLDYRDNLQRAASIMTAQQIEAARALARKMLVPGHLLQALDEYLAAQP